MQKLSAQIVSRIFIKFSIIFGNKWTKNFEKDDTGELQTLFEEDWAIGLRGIDMNDLGKAIDYCRMNLDWPPSIAQFRKICQEQSGLPSPSEVMQLAIRRDFSHPLVKLIYERIGSWDFSHDKETTLLKKINRLYNNSIHEVKQQSLLLENKTKPNLKAVS